jgi:hypothetical protein
MAEDMFRQIHKANSNVDMDLTADIYKLRLRLHPEWATATRGRVQLVVYKIQKPRYLTILWVSMVCYMDSFTYLTVILDTVRYY